MAESANNISRYYHTLRYLKPRQTIGRSIAGFKRRFLLSRAPGVPENLESKLGHKAPFLFHEPWNCRQKVLKGEFTFLNSTKSFEREIDWQAPDMPLLWRFNLHYFNYLHDLEDSEKENICLDWIKNNPEGNTVGWHPYPLSLRIVNWCKEDLSNPEILKSLYRQAAFLYRNLETYHPGNHLLENARALIFGGICFLGQGESVRWLGKGLKIFQDELPQQVLSDGGYFERSTMYHAIMLENFLDILNILDEQNISLPFLKDSVCSMGDFLLSLTHPDGTISLFNDSTDEIAPSAEEILRYLKTVTGYNPVHKCDFPETGYFIHRGKKVCLMIDGGIVGPDHLPAHSHADIFSYELSVNGEKIITDSGVYEYAQGPMRKYVRSTMAHNTVSVDRMDQAECWSSFRLARRFPPKEVRFSKQGSRSCFYGRFEGYASLIGDGICHERNIETDEEKKIITVKDAIAGKGRHLAESFIHIDPASRLTQQGSSFLINNGGHMVKIVPVSGLPSVEEGWYCPQFGRRIKSQVITLKQDMLPALLSYRIEF
ncbi:MAG: heparinase II/III family protein [Acidobacteriota bacterium]